MIDVLRIPIAKADLMKLTPEERGLFLLLGYASNQVNALWKLVIIATNRSPTDPVDERVSAAQAQIFVRLLVGVMREAWALVEKRFLQAKLGKEFVSVLDPQARAALESLKKRFGQSNMIVAVRTHYAFHHPELDDMEEAFQLAAAATSEDADWSLYMSNTLLNCFFFVSDFVIAHGITRAVGETDILDGHRKLLGDLAPIADELSEFTFGFAAAIFRKHFGSELTATIVAKLKDAPQIGDLTLPFYIEAPAEAPIV
jgi:hypothetical protein